LRVIRILNLPSSRILKHHPSVWICLSLLFIGLISCAPDPKTLELDLPADRGMVWNYDVLEIQRGDTTFAGTIRSEIIETGTIEGLNNAVQFEYEMDFERYKFTERPVRFTASTYRQNGDYIDIYTESYFDLIDRTLDDYGLDTMFVDDNDPFEIWDAANESNQYTFLTLNEMDLGWTHLFYRGANPDVPEEIHQSYSFPIYFIYRQDTLSGSVSLKSNIRFDAFDFVELTDSTSILTNRMLLTTYFDFDLKRNGDDLPPFRALMEFYNWMHPEQGVLKRERKPFGIFVPQLPSRYPIIEIPGQIWKLTSVEAFSLGS